MTTDTLSTQCRVQMLGPHWSAHWHTCYARCEVTWPWLGLLSDAAGQAQSGVVGVVVLLPIAVVAWSPGHSGTSPGQSTPGNMSTTSLTLHSWSRLLSNILTTIICKKFYRCAHTFDMLPSATSTRSTFSLPGLTVCAHCLLTLLNILELNNWWIVNFVETKYTWIMPKLPKNYFSIKPNSRVKRIMTIYHAREQKLKF